MILIGVNLVKLYKLSDQILNVGPEKLVPAVVSSSIKIRDSIPNLN